MLKGYQEATSKSKSQKDAVFFIKQKLDAAKWFIDAIKQRQQTLLVTMNTIMHYQLDYFLSGDERKLKPMILKDIADQIQMDISTVSRVANSKYVATPYGTKLIKEFFSESMKNDQGEAVSTKEIKKILETVISEEDKRKPLTDERLAAILKGERISYCSKNNCKIQRTTRAPRCSFTKGNLVKFQKLISALLHPIVLPTIGVMLYFFDLPTFHPKRTAIFYYWLCFYDYLFGTLGNADSAQRLKTNSFI